MKHKISKFKEGTDKYHREYVCKNCGSNDWCYITTSAKSNEVNDLIKCKYESMFKKVKVTK